LTGQAPAAVACRGLTKRFGGASGVLAVNGLDLDVPAGSVFGLLGPNGAGKTTTLRLITGLARPTGGTVEIDGVQVAGAADRGLGTRRSIGVLDQDPRYYGWMTGRELVVLAGRLQGLSSSDAAGRATETLDVVGLSDAAKRRISGYSGGMRQRLGIAQALVSRPRLLVLDEPVSSLDPEGRRDLLVLIEQLGATATVIFSTHVLTDIERICDRVGIIDHGRLITEGPLDELLARFAQPLYRLEPEPEQTAAIETLTARLREAPWVDDVRVDAARIMVSITDEKAASAGLLPLIVAAGVRLAAFERVRPSLEDVFLRLVGRETGDEAAA
jgi:ABC-2 type transport system ATP-binding protein